MRWIIRIIVTAIVLLISTSCESTVAPVESNVLFTEEIRLGDSVNIPMTIGDFVSLDNSTEIKFNSLIFVQGCPENVLCDLGGHYEAELQINGTSVALEPGSCTYCRDYKINLTQLVRSPSSIMNNSYLAYIQITINDRKVILGDDESEAYMYTDPLTIRGVEVEGDSLYTVISYGGGCAEHNIMLLAFVENSMTSLPVINLKFSHDANSDACLAYITNNQTYSLAALKNYLKRAGYNNCILAIYTPESDKRQFEIVYEL